MTEELGLAPAPFVGDEVTVPLGDGPTVHGRIDRYTERMLTVVIDQPAPGNVFLHRGPRAAEHGQRLLVLLR